MNARVVRLPAPQLQTIAKDNVTRFANRDQHGTADLVLDVAIKEAIAAIRATVGTKAYRVARAELRLTLAGHSADRILGRTTR